MRSIQHVILYGSDKRQKMLGELLQQEEVSVVYCNNTEDTTEIAACQTSPSHATILLPVPCQPSLYEEILASVGSGNIVLGGNIPESFVRQCTSKGALVYDYLKSPAIAIHNAVATAEGAICEAICRSPWNLHNHTSLVLGYGRCGAVLADRLKGLGSHVTVSARDPEKAAKAETMGCKLLTRQSSLSAYYFIFNTVPAPVLNATVLDQLHPDVTIIDIASAPGGCDFSYCEKQSIRAYLCSGLPAKYAPKSSAEIIFRHLQEVFQIGSKGKKL